MFNIKFTLGMDFVIHNSFYPFTTHKFYFTFPINVRTYVWNEKKKDELDSLRIENIQSIKCCQMSVSSHKSFARKTNKNQLIARFGFIKSSFNSKMKHCKLAVLTAVNHLRKLLLTANCEIISHLIEHENKNKIYELKSLPINRWDEISLDKNCQLHRLILSFECWSAIKILCLTKDVRIFGSGICQVEGKYEKLYFFSCKRGVTNISNPFIQIFYLLLLFYWQCY